MKKNRWKRIAAFFMVLVLLLQEAPAEVMAENLKERYGEGWFDRVKEPEEEVFVVAEDGSIRDEYTKHFRMSDGSYVAAVYPEPVHYLNEEKEWTEIDNTLETVTEDGKTFFRNRSAAHSVKFPEEMGDQDALVIRSSSGYEISFRPEAGEGEGRRNSAASGRKKEMRELRSAGILAAAGSTDGKTEKMTAERKVSGVQYEDVFGDADLEYIVTPSAVKESIVVEEPGKDHAYRFAADLGGLYPVREEDGGIGLYRKEGDKVPEMRIEAPYMYDAAGEYSDKVSLDLEQGRDGYRLTVTADSSWINEEGRKFPVMIDPTVKLDVERADIHDTYVDDSEPSEVHLNDYYLYVGHNALGTARTYVKFDLPDLPGCSIITGASLVLQQYEYDPGNGGTPNHIYAYDCGELAWNESSLTWNTQPMDRDDLSSYTVLDHQVYRDNTTDSSGNVMAAAYAFDITRAAKRWYEEGTNNGIMLASSREDTKRRSRFCSANYSSDSRFYPAVWVAYVNNAGLEDYWTYKTADLGRSGTAYVSDYNGNFTYVHPDVSTSGERMTAGVSHICSTDWANNGGTFGNMRVGVGFRLDLFEKVEQIGNASGNEALYAAGYRLKYVDGDGTIHYFKAGDAARQYVHEFNGELTVTKHDDGTFTMEDDTDHKKTFGTDGYLTGMEDPNGDRMTVCWSDSKITYVEDGAGRRITFEYDGKYLAGIKDPAGRTISYSYQEGYLARITYPDGKSTVFQYDNEESRISGLITYDNGRLRLGVKKVTAKTGSFFRTTYLEVQGSPVNGSRSTASRLDYEYVPGQTIITDKKGKKAYITFDHAGRTVNVRDHEDNAAYADYNSSGSRMNTLSSASDTFASVTNLAEDHSAELGGTAWTAQATGGGQGETGIRSDKAYIGEKSLGLTGTSGTGRIGYFQRFAGTAGKTYTLSAYMNIPEGLSGTGGAYVGLTYMDTSGNWALEKGMPLTETDGWQRESITFTFPSNASLFEIKLVLEGCTGTVYFDGIQLEEGEAVNRYNLLENAGFLKGDTGWSYTSKAGSDGTVSGYHGTGIAITGEPDTRKNVYQEVRIDGKAGDTLVYGGWAEADASGQTNDDEESLDFKVTLGIHYADGSQDWSSELFEGDTSHLQYVCGTFTLAKACEKVVYYFTYNDNVNRAVFDDACLYLDNYGTSYEYNDAGRLTTVKDSTGGILSYTYDGPDISKITSSFDGEEKESCTYTYDDCHNLLTATTSQGIVTRYDYTPQTGTAKTYGAPVKVTVEDSTGGLSSSCTYAYTSDYNYLTSVTDQRGKTAAYSYDTVKGLLQSVTDAAGSTVSYTYDSSTDQLLSVSGAADASSVSTVSYSYSNDRLALISRNGYGYGFAYDPFGRLTEVTAAGQELVSHTYTPDHCISTSTYGNGDTVSYTYDPLARPVSVSYNGTGTFEYAYDREGLLAAVRDLAADETAVYSYDLAKRLRSLVTDQGFRASYLYEEDSLSSMKVRKDSQILADDTYTYSDEGLPVSTVWGQAGGTAGKSWTYDGLNRLSEEMFTAGNGEKKTESYTFVTSGGRQTGLVDKITYRATDGSGSTLSETGTLEYTYDDLGNILTVETDGALTDRYAYDGLGQLVRHDDSRTGKTWTYEYDAGGNLTTRKQHAYTTGTPGNVLSQDTYAYGNAWKDQLTAYNGSTITYDGAGNPLAYRGYTMGWQRGRQLASVSGNGTDLEFSYNADGLRTEKRSGSTVTEYYYAGDVLIAQYDGTSWLRFLYGADGECEGFLKDGTLYAYEKDQQGDITAIRNGSMDLVCNYRYDAWGDCTVCDSNGNVQTDPAFIGNVNPLRYRGYYYDAETGFYYVSSRYYDPEVGRFISADGKISGVGGDVRGYNLYSYCFNNPVNMTDPDGNWPQFIKKAVKWVTQKVIKPVTKTVKKALSKINRTYSTGINVSGTPSIFCFNAQGGISVDTKGNVAVQGSFSGGVTGGTQSASITVYQSRTNAPNINKLEGLGYQLGGSAGIPVGGVPLAGGADFNIIPDSATGKNYYGTTTSFGVGIPGAELHVEWGNTATWNATQFNIFDSIDQWCINIMEW